MPNLRLFACLLLTFLPAAAPLTAGVRASADYTIETETTLPGSRTVAGPYLNDATLGALSGPTGSGTLVLAKHGYIGQLYEVTGLQLGAPGTSVNEGASLQLQASLQLDDGTALQPAASDFLWSVLTGPVDSVSPTGLATAGIVYQTTSTAVRVRYRLLTAQLTLQVVNSHIDNFGSYAGDGIDDAWQVQYFGFDHPLAGPAFDPDGDGADNLFEYVTGTVPVDASSRFRLRAEPVPGQPQQRKLVFHPRLPGRIYTVQFTTDLAAGPWLPLVDFSTADAGEERSVTDLSATGPRRFYRVQVTLAP